MEIGIAVALDIISGADPRIGHDRTAAAWLEGADLRQIVQAGSGIGIEGVIRAELVAHFMGYEVYVESVSLWIGATGNPASLISCPAYAAQGRYAATASAKYVADIVAGIPDAGVHDSLILAQHGAPVIVGIGISGTIQEYQRVFLGNKLHSN